jgi:hypothetical protein
MINHTTTLITSPELENEVSDNMITSFSRRSNYCTRFFTTSSLILKESLA